MGGSTQVDVNANGHLFQEAEQQEKGNCIVGENLALGDIVYLKAADSKIWKFIGASEATAAAIIGVCDGTYLVAGGTTMGYYYKDGGTIASGLTVPAGDELWAKADGTLGNYTAVTSAQWSRRMGVGLSATSAQVSMGEVQQKP